jgi:hypothetical protein
MNFAGLFLLLVAHYFTGKGIVKLFRLQLSPVMNSCMSLLVGVPVISFVPCIIQLMKIPITQQSVGVGIAICTALCIVPLLINFKKPQFKIALPALYELPFFIVFAGLMIISIWRCYYYPATARDMLSGPELLAEYTVREKTMLNSVFTVDLQTTNNYLKSPFITCLQIIYKMFVQPFGQVWLSVLFVGFITWLYNALRQRVHPIMAGALLLCFFAIPDLYAYSYVMLYDYSNMVFFFCGFYFLAQYLQSWRINDFIFAAFLFGLATYIRTETLVFVYLIAPMLVYYYYRQKMPPRKWAIDAAVFVLVPAFFYFVCIKLFVGNFVPVAFDPSAQINPNLKDLSPLFKRFDDMNTLLIFSKMGETIYGDFVYFFCTLLVLDVIWPRRFSKEALIALYGVAVVYVGLPILGYLLPLADLTNTTKRSFFKALPMMLFYMSNSGIVHKISNLIKNWEYPQERAPQKKPVQAAATPKAQKRKV